MCMGSQDFVYKLGKYDEFIGKKFSIFKMYGNFFIAEQNYSAKRPTKFNTSMSKLWREFRLIFEQFLIKILNI